MRRRLQSELMDDPAIDAREHHHALAGLERINSLSMIARQLWSRIRTDAQTVRPEALTLLDLATGSGDVPIAIAKHARRDGHTLHVTGVDISPRAGELAAARAKSRGIAWRSIVADVTREPLPVETASVDVATCSLFLHHLKEDDIVRTLRELKRVARRRVLITDLRRCRAGWWAAQIAGRTLTRSRVVRVDAVRSVEGSLTPRELERLARDGGLQDCRIQPMWPYRMLLDWRPDRSTG
jgi:ubiquinone/menaquinone biosynthesis C-methylase UbiE